MRRIAAISAWVLIAAAFACLLPAQAQRNPLAPIVTDSFGQPGLRTRESSPAVELQSQDPFGPVGKEAASGLDGPVDVGPFDQPTRIDHRIDVEPRISALADEFSKALVSALQEKLIKVEQADRMVKELEIAFTVKRARIDLLRVARMLDKLDENTKGVDGSDQLGELRLQLKELQAAAGIVEVEWVPQQEPTLTTEAEQPKEE